MGDVDFEVRVSVKGSHWAGRGVLAIKSVKG